MADGPESIKGLSEKEVIKQRQIHGPNSFSTRVIRPDWLEFLNNFTNPLVIILMVISGLSFFMGEPINGVIIATMVIMSVTLNFFQEHKASKAATMLLQKVALMIKVRRDNKEEEIRAVDLVPKDIIVLNAGDMIPADCKGLWAKHCYANESSLTGESVPVEKSAKSTENQLFAGTSITSGTIIAAVENTGLKTKFAEVVKTLAKADEANDFTVGINNFSKMLVKVILLLVAAIFGISALFKHDLFTSFSFAIAVAVGLTPEFLPMIMSVTMTKGAAILAKKGIIVKKLTAIPAFGSMDILCTDKTGTLTEDKIRLVKYTDIQGRVSESVLTHAYLNSVLESGITNPLDEAIKAYKHLPVSAYAKVDELPFDFERKKLSVVVDHLGKRLLITKGAPEAVLEGATKVMSGDKPVTMTEAYQKRIKNEFEQLSQAGFRVLAIGVKEVPKHQGEYSSKDEAGATFLGFTSFLDPVKPEVKGAIDSLEAIRIKVKVISGDNELVCKKICEEADIPVTGLLLGSEAEKMRDEELADKLERVSICARFSPSQKERAIKLLRNNNHVVGYIGDGINDAPSLKMADVGISVVNAVDVAKEAADLIMTHKSLLDLHEGVVTGRTIFQNTMKYLLMGLSSNFGNMLSMLGAVILLPFLPMMPLQLLLNNFLYDFAQISIPTDQVDPDEVRTPRKWDMNYIKRFMFTMGPVSSVFDMLSFGILFKFFSDNQAGFQTGWFMESLATQALVIHVIRTKKIPFLESWPSLTLLISTLLIVAAGWIIPYIPVGKYFGFTPLPAAILGMLGVIVLGYLLLAQGVKLRLKPSTTE